MARIHETEIQVRFNDTDAMGHLNNATFATYAETARLAFLAELERAGAPPVTARPGAGGHGLILARLAVDYRRQVRFGEPVRVETSVERIGTTSFGLRQVVRAGDAAAADVSAVVVVFDYAAEAPRPIPPALRAALEAFHSA